MPTPSLLIVPARFKSGKLYSQLPTSGAGDFTVTRATNATRVNASGLIESVASGIPRLDYFSSDGTVGCPALLVEPSSQNLVFNSQTWTSANNWRADVSGNITTVTGAITAPDGTMTANAISPTAVSGVHGFASLGVTYASGTNYTMSAFFKQGAGVGRFVQLTYTTAMNSGAGFANFDLQLGTVAASGGTGNVAARIENYGNGWYRCIYTATCNANAASALGVLGSLISASGSTRAQGFAGVTSDVLYGWGAQVETGSVATSYIPTTTAAVTRNADVVSVSGAVSGSIGQTEGTIYIECQADVLTNDIIYINRSVSNSVLILKNSNNGFLGRIYHSSSSISFNTANNVTGMVKIALAYKSGDSAMFMNGVQVGTTNTTSITFGASLSNLVLGDTGFFAGQKSKLILDAALYTTRLTNAELQALTSL